MQQDQIEILMVDDRPENLLALEAVLASPSHRLVKKYSGEEALRYVLESDLSLLALILMDIHMPGMDGYETALLMRKRKELRNVPIMFMTAAYTTKSDVRQGYLSGSIDYILKPFDPDILRWKVENLVNLHRCRQELQSKNAELQQMNQKLLLAEQQLLKQQKLLEDLVEARTKQLEQSNRRFRSIFYTIPNLVAIRRLHDGKYLEVNDAWTEHTGYSLQQMNDANEPYFHTEIIDDRKDHSCKIQYRTRSGELKYGLLSIERLETGDEACELIVITDISEREVMEQQINRLERLNLIGEMAAGIAHEIRNPMTTIHGFLQMWKKSEQPLPKQYIDLMLSELLRANTIITEFLSLAGNKESSFTDHRICDVLDTLYPLIQAVALMSEKQVLIEHGTRKSLHMDEKEMRQVILNLAKNGLEAMEKGGTLTIRSYEEKGCVVIDVIDEGHGIPDEVIGKLGTPFFTTKENGTGLGLALCFSIIERHGGKMEIHSGTSGSTFRIRLPLNVPAAVSV